MEDLEIDWGHPKHKVLFNPRLPESLIKKINEVQWPVDQNLIWVATSGTSRIGSIQFFGHSYQSFLGSAQSVNQHLAVSSEDIWLCSLPKFHVGGLSIFARAYLAKNLVVSFDENWSAQKFAAMMEESRATLSSLVPTQVFDLVKEKVNCPQRVRAIVVGGGALSKKLYLEARRLGWPLLPSYGMTETASQVATADLDSLKGLEFPKVFPLNHAKIKSNSKGFLCVSCNSLFSATIEVDDQGFQINSFEGDRWFETQDKGCLTSERGLEVFGRGEQVQKVSGELVSLNQLAEIVNEKFPEITNRLTFLFSADERKGAVVVMVLDNELYSETEKILKAIKSESIPLAVPQRVYFVSQLIRNELGKIEFGKLKNKLGLN